ncbi:MAG TPA: ParB/RepB/Spo0J family partition protein [Methanocella sp.]|uniref:ParB/RepB/Spo0J family partition protein n=1 Tax=Methanocella sp. TaxID=2052833 RepID=UPI002B9F920A|nr:ParB/RepB/Spo0J family partition protein [Methanocella sp.]HTY90209.1 ParB/RepB/Spo0J family partition protein [Methanocella sp.]
MNNQDIPFQTIPINRIEPDSDGVRKSSTDIGGLKYTISDVGLLQPIIVRKSGEIYTVIDGHRRLRALKELEVAELIVGREVIVNVDENEADNRFRQIIANIQREDISDIELGHAFVTLKEKYGYQYNEIADVIGKDRHYVTAKVGLATRLAPGVQELAAGDKAAAAEPYSMNVNILEAISRLPERVQMDVYRKVKAGRMDKAEALDLIRSARNGALDRGPNGSGVEVFVKKVNKDLDLLAVKIKDDRVEKEKILPAIESLIEKLNSLRLEISDDGRIMEKSKTEVRVDDTA